MHPTNAQANLMAHREPLVESAALLVDVDNFSELRDVTDAGLFASTLMRMLRAFLNTCNREIDQLTVRLYGGWYEGPALTPRASVLAQLIAQADPFPIRYAGSLISGVVELANGPVHAPGLVLPNTFRARETAPRLRRTPGLDHPTCCKTSSCSAKRFARWSEGGGKLCPTEGCSVTFSEAFFAREQKMIDTMLSVDLIELCAAQRLSAVAIASDDTDFIPALLYAKKANPGTVAVIRTNTLDPLLSPILETAGVYPIGL